MPKSEKVFDPAKNLCRRDIIIRPWGLVIRIRWSKTIQFRERQLLIPVMRLRQGHPLCPAQAYERHITEFPTAPTSPAFLRSGKGHATPITHSVFTHCARSSVMQAFLPPNYQVTVFVVVELPMPSVAVLPWNLSASRETGLRAPYFSISLNHWNNGF